MKALIWIMLAVTGTAFGQPADEAKIDVSGKLIAPPCTPRFPTSQQLKLGDANLNQLIDDSVAATDIPLIFDCQADSQVSLTFSAGLGNADNQTLLTNRAGLGLHLGLLSKSAKADFSLGETSNWTVEKEPLKLTLRVKPVTVGELPDAGSYSATLLMQMTYR